MKINCEFPFENYVGHILINKEPRRVICMTHKQTKSRTTISYARYLMSVKEKRILEKREQVDHIDNNKLNDVIENLQILSAKENCIKRNIYHQKTLANDIILICPICKNKFSKPSNQLRYKIVKGKIPCCSRKCGGIFSHITKLNNLLYNRDSQFKSECCN